MICDEIKERIYEWSQGTLSEKDRLPLAEHLQECHSCQAYAEQVKHLLSLLNELKPQPLSAEFTERVLKKSRQVSLPERPLWRRLKEWFQVPYVKWPLEGLAATAVILIALVAYKEVSLTKPSKIEMTPRGIQMEFSGTSAQYPIIILTKNLDRALSDLKGLLKIYDGRITQTLSQGQEIRVSLDLKKEKETAFLTQLNKLGMVKQGQDRFQDDDGNMVVILKLERPE